jgi:homospermidine synthase
MKIPFTGHVLVLGAGSVSRCLLPLLRRHLEMDFTRLTVMDFEDVRPFIGDTLAAGATFVQHRITPNNLASTLSEYLQRGDLLIDLAWNIDTLELLQWCHDHGVLYINTSVEVWDPYIDLDHKTPMDRTLYVRHQALKKLVGSWAEPGPTAVVEHGANPGLVSHWARVALEDISHAMLRQLPLESTRRATLEAALAVSDYARMSMTAGVKVIHISERDSQIANVPKRVDEFVNTWSVEGFYEEGIAPAEMGWGTHERMLPAAAHVPAYGPGNAICLARMGINTWVRSWTPGGPIIGMVVRHGEAYTLSDFLTVWDDDRPIYRPTVHYAYLPSDAAIASLHELRMNDYDMQSRVRIMNDEIIDGKDELGVLLLGHDLNGWWTGSQLDIHEARQLAPGQNATTLQVAAAVLGAVAWMISNPARGVCVPEDLPHRQVLAVAQPYLGPTPSVQTDWTPLDRHWEAFSRFGQPLPPKDDVWQFDTFLVNKL